MSRLLRISIWVSVLGALLAFGLYLGDRVKADPGYVLFAYGGYTIEMSLWAFIILFIAATRKDREELIKLEQIKAVYE